MRILLVRTLLLLFASFLVSGCGQKASRYKAGSPCGSDSGAGADSDGDTDADGGADRDADSDADGDGDGDADTDADTDTGTAPECTTVDAYDAHCDTETRGSRKVCMANACVQCANVDAHCTTYYPSMPHCQDGYCYGCLSDSHCSAPTSHCAPSRSCVECLKSGDCAGGKTCTDRNTCGDACDNLEYLWSFETGDDGFTHAVANGTTGYVDEWARGYPTLGNWTGCYSGSNCWKTNLSAVTANCHLGALSRAVDLSTCSGRANAVQLKFWHRYQLENGYDGLIIEASSNGGTSWTNVTPTWCSPAGTSALATTAVTNCSNTPSGYQGMQGYMNDQTVWTQVTCTIPDDYRTSGFIVRFVLNTDEYNTEAGWIIDDVQLVTTP